MQTDRSVVIIPQNSFYKARLGDSANIGISTISHDMSDVKFKRKLLSAKVTVRKLKFVENSRFLVRTIFHKKPVVKLKRILVARSNISPETSSSCEKFSESVRPLANESKVKVSFTDDESLVKIVDKMPALLLTVVDNIRMSPLSYLKPSLSEDDYGLGSYRDIMEDDADRPRKVIPNWALEDRVNMQMRKQAGTDTNMIFAPRVLNVSDLSSMFPSRPRAIWENPWCDSPKKTARGKENEGKGKKKKLRL